MTKTPTRALLLSCALATLLATSARAQDTANAHAPTRATAPTSATTRNATTASVDTSVEVLRQLREQRDEIERLRLLVEEQTRLLTELRARVESGEQRLAAVESPARPPSTDRRASNDPRGNPTDPRGDAAFTGALYDKDAAARVRNASADSSPANVLARADTQGATVEERVRSVEEGLKKTGETLARQLGSINFSGDVRLRYESIYGQQNALPSSDDPSVLGNPLTPRQRLRLRARLALRGQLTKEFEWGLRFATGAFPDVTSSNQTLTDFFSHKNFALDQAYVTYKPERVAGLQVQGGKFDVPWLRTEMTLDNDLTVEGLNESYTRSFKKSPFKSLTFVAWQLPFLERNSAFVLGPDGRVSLDQSARAGRDLALYGAQLRTRIEPSSKFGLTLSAADLYFSGTQFITPAQVFGANVQVPVTVNIPATATSPAQTLTGVATIPRDQLVSGNANLGVSIASNNATNRDGRLSSGYNLVDLLARADFTHSKRWPVMVLLNWVVNTQARDVVLAGPGGANRFLANDENMGLWAEFQVGKTQARGDFLLNYTFIRIEKDAVLTPFNYSDILQGSDVRVHRFTASYAADPRVTLSLTGFVNQRPNGLLGPFGTTPPGSLNRTNTRLQLDTVFRF